MFSFSWAKVVDERSGGDGGNGGRGSEWVAWAAIEALNSSFGSSKASQVSAESESKEGRLSSTPSLEELLPMTQRKMNDGMGGENGGIGNRGDTERADIVEKSGAPSGCGPSKTIEVWPSDT